MKLYTARCPTCHDLLAVKAAETKEQQDRAQMDVTRWKRAGALVKLEEVSHGDVRWCLGGCQ